MKWSSSLTAPDVRSAVWAYSARLQNFKPHGELTYGFWNASEWR